MSERPRFVPGEPFPPYSYVPGGSLPHPVRDPAGHSYGVVRPPCPAPNPDGWRECRPYLYGIDLFNHGYYWEAHEVWESIWHAGGRGGAAGSFIKGLIKLAAAGVKAREGRAAGIQMHARRAAELFQEVAGSLPPRQRGCFGLSLEWLVQTATEVARRSSSLTRTTDAKVEIVFAFVITPGEGSQNAVHDH